VDICNQAGQNTNNNLQEWKMLFSKEADTRYVCERSMCSLSLTKPCGQTNQNTSDISTMQCTLFIPKVLGLPEQPPFKMI
jgi:hypothetical protein